MLFNLHYIGYQALEKAPFEISRPEGSARYLFFHFTSSVKYEIDGEIFDASPGSCIIYEPKHPQKFFVDNINLNHDYLDFECCEPDFFGDIRLPLNTIISPSLSKFIISSIEKIHQETNSNRLGSDYIIQSLMERLFVSISRKTHNFSFNSADYEKTLQRKFEQIRLNMYHNPSEFKVKDMASMLDFSISHFGTLYKKFFNVKPIDDLTKARVHFIEHNDIHEMSTYELTQKLGFDSTEYYYRWFKQNFQMTPKTYKNLSMKG